MKQKKFRGCTRKLLPGIVLLQLLYWQPSDAQTALQPLHNKSYHLLFADEFNKTGKPDEQHWLLRNNHKFGGYSAPENVFQATSDEGMGCLHILFSVDSSKSREKRFKGGGAVSVHNFGYGYYETKVKLYGGSPELAGFHQSFWTMGLTGTNEGEGAGVYQALLEKDLYPQENQVLEIDGFEHDSRGQKLGQNYHIYTPLHKSEAPKPANYADKDISKWIVAGYEWLPDQVNFYIDGQYLGSKKLDGAWNVYAAQNFWLTALPLSWSGPLMMPRPGASMQVDYFRYYAKSLPGVNRVSNAGFEYQAGNRRPNYPVAWIVARNGHDTSAVKVVRDSLNARSGNSFLCIGSHNTYRAKVKQIIEYIPNGTYSFSAWVKSTGGLKNVGIAITNGANDRAIPIKESDAWTKVSLSAIKVKNNQVTITINAAGNAMQMLMVDDIQLVETK